MSKTVSVKIGNMIDIQTDIYEIQKGRVCPTSQIEGSLRLRCVLKRGCTRLLNTDIDTTNQPSQDKQ